MTSPARNVANDIVALRLSHCRAQQAAQQAHYHLAALHYRSCLETAEQRGDCQAVQFFAVRLAECYDAMGMAPKAEAFRSLAGCCLPQGHAALRRPDSDAEATA